MSRAVSRGFWAAVAVGTLAAALSAQSQRATSGMLVFIGTYTRAGSEGIYALRFDTGTGALRQIGLAAKTSNPSFLALHPSGRWLYAVNEDHEYQGQKTGAVSAFTIDRQSGRLALLDAQPSDGAAPCHISIDRTGRNALVANYNGGNVAVLPIDADGRLGRATFTVQYTGSSANRDRQAGPHAHAVILDPSNRFALTADLGTDKVRAHQFEAERGRFAGVPAENIRPAPGDPRSLAMPPGSGPRHLAFAPSGQRVYVINELSSTIASVAWDPATGGLKSEAIVPTLPPGYAGTNTTAEIVVHPTGRFVYGSNRGHDSIAVFRADAGGKLTLVEHEPTGGKTPRNFAIDPTGRWLIAANQDSNSLVVFRINPETGALDRVGPAVSVVLPVCVTFVPEP
jgi:6-phosphogluconolactonase